MKPPAIVLLLILSGCSKATTEPTLATSAPAPPTAAPPAPSADPKAGLNTAVAFMTALQEQTKVLDVRPPITRYTADTDPNHMLGRQHGYIEKIAFGAAGGDGSIEVFPNLAEAKARAEYIDTIGKASALGDGYDYLNEKRFALLRLPHETTPAQATQWKALLDRL
jgi:hypothetical protein